MDSSPVKLTREQLYEEVWETPIQRLSAKYGLSDVGLAKVCKRMNIPRPPRGYWRRLETGTKVKRKPLPAPMKNTQLEVEFRQSDEIPKKRAKKKPARVPVRPPEISESLSDPHPLVANTLKRCETAKEDKYGILIPKAKRVLDIKVSRPQLDRSLRLIDTLIKSWEAEGHVIKLLPLDGDDGLGTFLCSGEERVRISITETMEQYDPGPTEDEKLHPKWEWEKRVAYRSTGSVMLRLDANFTSQTTRFHRKYRDTLGVPMELKAKQAWAAGMEYFEKRQSHLEAERKREEERKKQRLDWEREWAEQRKEELRKRREQERVTELVKAAASWTEANQVRSFAAACEQAMKERAEDPTEIEGWIEWAHSVAKHLDPLHDEYPNLHPSEDDEEEDSGYY